MKRGIRQCARRQADAGFSLVELLIVATLLSIAALVAAPSMNPVREEELSATAQTFADGFRYARSEALRTAIPHGVRLQTTPPQMRVFRLDGTTPVYDVYHPVRKQIYAIDNLRRALMSIDGSWLSGCADTTLMVFDARGAPHCGNPVTTPLTTGSIKFLLGAATRIVWVYGETGRVVVL